MTQQDKPSLHEIAAMPFPASQEAMRKFYNPHWGKPVSDDGEKRSFKVRVDYEVRSEESKIVNVEACSEEEAIELAEAEVEKSLTSDEEIFDAEIIE